MVTINLHYGNPQWLEVPVSRTNSHGSEDVQAIEVDLPKAARGRINKLQLMVYKLYAYSQINDFALFRYSKHHPTIM